MWFPGLVGQGAVKQRVASLGSSQECVPVRENLGNKRVEEHPGTGHGRAGQGSWMGKGRYCIWRLAEAREQAWCRRKWDRQAAGAGPEPRSRGVLPSDPAGGRVQGNDRVLR